MVSSPMDRGLKSKDLIISLMLSLDSMGKSTKYILVMINLLLVDNCMILVLCRSGKSNILDAICFLLGITNLSHVRAANLQELVYKNGQAGVTKATVSITFDNRDKKQSPLGYEHYDEVTITRQVVIGGKNKYLINGSNVQNNRVQDFFRSVQLNVNNPHFLIMQGRITKVY